MPVCKIKIALLENYVSWLGVHSDAVRDYATYIHAGRDGGGLDAIKARVAESKDEAFQARQRYDAHIREHGCESHKN